MGTRYVKLEDVVSWLRARAETRYVGSAEKGPTVHASAAGAGALLTAASDLANTDAIPSVESAPLVEATEELPPTERGPYCGAV